jgi:hypothetical protein
METTNPNDIPSPNLNAAARARDAAEGAIAATLPAPATDNGASAPAAAKLTDEERDRERKRVAHERALDEAKPLGAAEIVRKRDVRVAWVLTPHLGGKVLVRALSATERDAFEASLVIMRGKERKITTANIRAKLCALAIIDPVFYSLNGEVRRAFDDEQIIALGEVDAGELSKIYDKAAELSGISEADVEELAGNSRPTVSGGSSSK